MGYDAVKLFIQNGILTVKRDRTCGWIIQINTKNTEPLEETVIGSLRSEMDAKYVLFNVVKELPVTLEEIKFKTKFDKFITQTKKNE